MAHCQSLEREMNVVLMYMSNVGTQASLFAGFVFVAFYEPLFNNNPDVTPLRRSLVWSWPP